MKVASRVATWADESVAVWVVARAACWADQWVGAWVASLAGHLVPRMADSMVLVSAAD